MTACWYGLSKFLCWLTLRVGFGLVVSGREHVPARGACIVASNHVSFLDPVVVGVACPRRLAFMARDTLFAQPLLGVWLRAVGAIPVHRHEADPSAIRAALRRLRAGRPLALFPEGGRQLSGALGSAKRGVGLLAMAARAPIVPVYLEGTFRALPPGARWFRRAKIRVAFGPAVAYTERSAPSAPEAARAPARPSGSPGRARQEQLAQAVTDRWRRLAEEME